MAITDELREAIGELMVTFLSDCKIGPSPSREAFYSIADRIDAAHDKAIASVMNDALYHANDKDMAEYGWVRLPKDADGEYIHIGDRMDTEHFGTVEVEGFVHSSIAFYNYADQPAYLCTSPATLCHHHAPTVEDVLREFICDHEEGVRDEVDLIAEYAKRLRLAGSDAE